MVGIDGDGIFLRHRVLPLRNMGVLSRVRDSRHSVEFEPATSTINTSR